MEKGAITVNNKSLSTPFSIKDILTRNNTTITAKMQSEFQRRKSLESSVEPFQPDELSIYKLNQFGRSQDAMDNSPLCDSKSEPENHSFYTCYSENNNEAIYGPNRESKSRSQRDESNCFYGNELGKMSDNMREGGNGYDHRAHVKMFLAANEGRHMNYGRDCPIDMRRCTSNDSGKFFGSMSFLEQLRNQEMGRDLYLLPY